MHGWGWLLGVGLGLILVGMLGVIIGGLFAAALLPRHQHKGK